MSRKAYGNKWTELNCMCVSRLTLQMKTRDIFFNYILKYACLDSYAILIEFGQRAR